MSILLIYTGGTGLLNCLIVKLSNWQIKMALLLLTANRFFSHQSYE